MNEIINRMDGAILSRPEYSFLKSDERLKNITLLGYGGSYAYGTNVESSDIDIRGIALNSPAELLTGKDFEIVVDNPTDTAIYSFNKIVRLLTACNPNVIEILGLKPEHYFLLTEEGQKLLDNKSIFLSKQCVKSFGGYANQQLYRLQQKSLCALTKEEYNAHTMRVLKGMINRFEEKYSLKPGQITPRVGNNGDLMIDLNLCNISADQVSGLLGEINKTIKDYSEPSRRNARAETHGKIAKHSMHLLRLYMMGIDILEKGEINTYREKEHALLMDVRNGRYLDENGMPIKEFFDIVKQYESDFNMAAKASDLPERPDVNAIQNLQIEINSSIFK